jgi:hypothetical protein
MLNSFFEVTILLHRSHFEAATGDPTKDPLSGPFGTSVIAAFRSAWSGVAAMSTCCDRLPSLIYQYAEIAMI